MDYPLIYSAMADVGSNLGSRPSGLSCIAFDSEQELIWTGSYSGHITSFVPSSEGYNHHLAKYTSFHVAYDSDVRQISTIRQGVLSLTKDTLRLSVRRGLTSFTHKSEHEMKDLRCMLYKSQNDPKAGHLLMAGNQEKLIEIDLETQQHLRTVDIFEDAESGIKGCYYMKGNPRFICMSDCEGKIVLRDTDQLKVQHHFNPTAKITSMDVSGNYLVTCTSSSQLLMIYDLREMKLVSATQLYLPQHIKFLSRFTTKCCLVSRNGYYTIVDLTCPNTTGQMSRIFTEYEVNPTCFDISATDQALAFGDNHDIVYVHGTCDKFNINSNPQQPEFADPILPTAYYPLLGPDCFVPISEISPFPYWMVGKPTMYNQLASYMPPVQCMRTYRPVPQIAPDLLRSMRVVGNIGYVVNTSGSTVPQLVNNYTSTNGNGSKRSSPEGNEFGTDQMPHRYLFLEPNHNKVDKDEYDFARYNHSTFPGLDSTLPNSYANNMIQCLYFIPPVRAAIVSHICIKEYCLVCELGFLFHMLDNAPSQNPCQASNFLRAFRTIPEVSAFKLILPEEESLRKQVNFCKLTQQWLRFLLHQLHRESLASNGTSGGDQAKNSFVTEHFSLCLTRRFKCKCGYTWQSPYSSFPVTLIYPSSLSSTSNATTSESTVNSDSNGAKQSVRFIDLLRSSILTEQAVQEYCEKCTKFHNSVTERRCVVSLPNLFAINTGLDNDTAVKFWENQTGPFTNQAQSTGKTTVEVDNCREQRKLSAKVCRYGRYCKFKPNCKFYHDKSENPGLDDNDDLASWIPLTIYMSSNNGRFEIKDNLSDWKHAKKANFVEYTLVSVTSVVKSGEETFGNIVSAIKIDKSYFDARRKQLLRKRRRQQIRQQLGMACASPGPENGDSDSDQNDDLVTLLEDNQLFTVDIRNGSALDYSTLPVYKPDGEWYLFNHYSINPITIEEVTTNDLSWKIPTILMYMRKEVLEDGPQSKLQRTAKNVISSSVFTNDAQQIPAKSISFLPLDLSREMPKRGDIVAMDAEFVMLNHEETELRSDGTRTTIKPSHKSVARISCVRGSGPMQGIPFIDDYISTQDQVADYMTKFSGIQPGDLDVTLSSKHLTTLKSTYLKLRFLVDNGVIFVGHGLRNDFRVINLVVPPEQVIDTVYLFQSPTSKRMVSLRFLAWHFLNLNIQSETHDSIEDAKTALALYHKYKELEANGLAQQAIEQLYQVGKDCGWKILEY